LLTRRRCCCTSPGQSCSPCNIPEHNLTWTFNYTSTTETIALTYTPNTFGAGLGVWRGLTRDGSLLFEMQCVSGTIGLSVTDTSDGSPWVGGSTRIVDSTCSPFHIHFGIGPGTSINFYADDP